MSGARRSPLSHPASAPGVPAAFICPISKAKMVDPVIDRDGNSYERAAVLEWLKTHTTSPLTGRAMKASDLKDNKSLAKVISEHMPAPSPVVPAVAGKADEKFKFAWSPAPTFSEGWITVMSPYGMNDGSLSVMRSTLKGQLSALGFAVDTNPFSTDGSEKEALYSGLTYSAVHSRTRETLFITTEGPTSGGWECWVYLTCRASFTGLDALLQKMDFDLACCVLTTIPHGHSVIKFTPFSRSARGFRYEIITDTGTGAGAIDSVEAHVPSTLLQLVFEGQPENVLGKVMLEYVNQELERGGPTITMFELAADVKTLPLQHEILLEATEFWLVERGMRSNVTLFATDVQSAEEAAMFRLLGFKCCDGLGEEYYKKLHTDCDEYKGLAYRAEHVVAESDEEDEEGSDDDDEDELRAFTYHAAQQFGGWGAQAVRNARDAAAGNPLKRSRE